MFHSAEFEKINKEYQKIINDKQQNTSKIWMIILLVFIMCVGLVFLIFGNIMEEEPGSFLVPIYGGIIFAVLLGGFLISKNVPSEKPTFNYLFDEVYKKLNLDEQKTLVYTPFQKEKFTFNKIGGLYTRIASVNVKRHVEGYTDSAHKFDIYDCTMVTSNGKSSTVHFNGVYYNIALPTTNYLQVRTSSSPRLKGHKYDRVKEIEDLRVFIDEDTQLLSKDEHIINFVRKIKSQPNIKHVAFGIIPGEVHVGITYKKHPARKQKSLTSNQLDSIYDYFTSELEFIEEVINTTGL